MKRKLILENQNSTAKKVITFLTAGLTISALILVIGNGGNIAWFPPFVVFPLVALTTIISIIVPFIWQNLEKNRKIDSTKIYGILYSIIRYAISTNVASFGWKKIFGLQFLVPNEISNLPMKQQTGEWLTWYYFGYSQTFGLTIAIIQLVGAYLLLFRKTLMLGSIILLSVMLNLTLICIFYQMNAGALLQSAILTFGIIFLILLDYNKIKVFLFNSESKLPTIYISKEFTRNILRLLALAISLAFTIYLKTLLKP